VNQTGDASMTKSAPAAASPRNSLSFSPAVRREATRTQNPEKFRDRRRM
jgi:hypothetical protein